MARVETEMAYFCEDKNDAAPHGLRANAEISQSPMKYLEFTFTLQPQDEAAEDVLAAVLAEAGFDSFVRTAELDCPSVGRTDDPERPVIAAPAPEGQFKAYVPAATYDGTALKAALAAFPLPGVAVSYTKAEAEDRNWNEEWEQHYFQPLVIGDRCVVAGTFHKDVPRAAYNITINPQMSFGTGHHATTAQMIGRLLDDDMRGRDVLDMGCGTGILAILARMRGAAHCTAIDNDEWCVRNTLDNLALNHVDGIDVCLGDASTLADKGPFDVVIANINRNILLRDLRFYVPRMKAGAIIYMSGFYVADIARLREEAERLGLSFVDARSEDDWACIKFHKP